MQRGDGVFCIVTQGVTQCQHPYRHAVLHHHHHGLPGLFQRLDLLAQPGRRKRIRGNDQDVIPFNVGFNPGPDQRPLCGGGRDVQPTRLRLADYRLCQRVGGALFDGSGQGEQRIFTDLLRINARDLRFTHRQRTGFIEGDMLYLAQLLQRRTAFNQRSTTRRGRQAGGNGRRRGDHQRARATNQQQRQTFINPALPGCAHE